MYKLNRNIVAVFLLLTFVQGGMRPWMHHWFHQNGPLKSSCLTSSGDIRVKCDCLQDANMPIQDTPVFALTALQPIIVAGYTSADIDFTSLDRVFYSLKGPPTVC